MAKIKYVCTHCGRKFEENEKEIVECPGCYWSTSVKKADDSEPVASQPSAPSTAKSKGAPFSFPQFNPKPILIALTGIVIVAGFFWISPRIKNLLPAKSTKPSVEIPKPSGPAVSFWDQLSPEEKAALEKRVQPNTDRTPSEEEKKILEYRAPFKTGFVEQLPSQVWTIEGFRELIAEQEAFYKVPLSRSYKGKLDEGFKKNYVPGGDAFNAGNLLDARNYWIASLSFPIYGNDLQKHRGVALTMLRPFIADTLSKIGALNNALLEKQIRDQEKRVSDAYQSLFAILESSSWSDAVSKINEIRSLIAPIENQQSVNQMAPPYPPILDKVDDGIRATLIDLLNAPSPATADFGPLKSDLDAKEKVVQSFLAMTLEEQQMIYDRALDLIRQQSFKEAAEELQKIQFPIELRQDAEEKIKILKKEEQI